MPIPPPALVCNPIVAIQVNSIRMNSQPGTPRKEVDQGTLIVVLHCVEINKMDTGGPQIPSLSKSGKHLTVGAEVFPTNHRALFARYTSKRTIWQGVFCFYVGNIHMKHEVPILKAVDFVYGTYIIYIYIYIIISSWRGPMWPNYVDVYVSSVSKLH